MKSSNYYEENQGGEQMQEGVSDVSLRECKYINTKDGPAFIVKYQDDANRVCTEFLYEDNPDNFAAIAQLARIAKVTWGDNASGDEVAAMLTANLFRLTLETGVSKKTGKAFVRDRMPLGGGSAPAPAQPTAQPASSQQAPAPRKTRF